jgi:hypothetical protein
MLMSVSAVTQNGFDTVLPCQRLWTFKQVGFWLVWLSVTFARRLVGRLHYAEYSPCPFPPFVMQSLSSYLSLGDLSRVETMFPPARVTCTVLALASPLLEFRLPVWHLVIGHKSSYAEG